MLALARGRARSPRSSPSTPRRAGMQEGEAVPVIAATSTAANVSCILGGIVVFGDPMPADTLGIVLQGFAFALVVVAALRHAAAGARGRRERLLNAASGASRRCCRVLDPAVACTDRRTPSTKWSEQGESWRRSRTSRRGNLQELRGNAPVDALHPHGRVRRGPRDPDHRPRRGLLRLRPARPPLPRRAVRAVLREHRPRPRRRRPGRRRPGARSSASSRTGPTRTRRRSSSPRASPRSRPATSTASSSPRGGSRGGRLGAQALPPVPQAHRQPGRYKVIARKLAYHGTTMGALTATGIPDARRPFEPLFPGSAHVAEHEPVPARGRRPGRGDPRADRVRGARDRLVRDPRAGAELRRLLRPAATATSSGARDLRRVRGPASSPTRSSARGAGSATWFGAERYGYEPDIITTAKGLTSSYAPMGAVIASDRVFEPFVARQRTRSCTASRSAGTRWRRRSRWPTSTCSSDEGAARERPRQRGRLRRDARLAARHPDRRRRARDGLLLGASSSSRTSATKETFTDDECEWLLRDFLSAEIFERGLICRADDRGDPVIQLAPPLIAGPGAVRGDPRRAAPGPRGGLAEARPAL